MKTTSSYCPYTVLERTNLVSTSMGIYPQAIQSFFIPKSFQLYLAYILSYLTRTSNTSYPLLTHLIISLAPTRFLQNLQPYYINTYPRCTCLYRFLRQNYWNTIIFGIEEIFNTLEKSLLHQLIYSLPIINRPLINVDPSENEIVIGDQLYILNITTRMYVWGRNNNHLFKQNHKKTYSLPQKLPINKTINKCVAGYDYIILLTSQSIYCYFQSAIYHLSHFKEVVDVSTTDNMIVVVTQDGSAFISQFSSEKIIANELTSSKINIKHTITRAFMNYGDIFLMGQESQIFHLQRNEWYETKTYSDPQIVQGFGGKQIKHIAPALNINYFLTQDGKIFCSTKKDPTKAVYNQLQEKFIQITASDYFVGIGQNGRLYLWGKYLDTYYQVPTQFGKISQKFKKISLSCDNGFALTQKGQGWIWGKNANGQLGISDYEPRTQPFPLITMQNEILTDFVIGQGYTICLVQGSSTKKVKTKTNTRINETIVPTQQHKTSNHFIISSIPSINIADIKKNKSKSPNNTSFAKTQAVRQNPFKIKDNHTPSKNNRSKSPIQHNKSTSKSPVAKYISPYLQHQRQKSLSNGKPKKDLTKQSMSPIKSQSQFVSQINLLQQQNARLKKTMSIKESIIEDITNKIRLLEDAIQQHEKTLTSRDHQMEQYQKREKQYLQHIDELQKTIENLMKSQTDRSSEDNLHNMFKELKTEFNKEKDYYVKKMKEYQDLLNNQRSHYNTKIRDLEQEIQTYRSSNKNIYTLNDSRNNALCDRANKDNLRFSRESIDKSRIQQQNRHRMELIVSRIEDSKVRIGKSATKLNQFLGQ